MPRVIRSSRATRDIVEILEYTRARWGAERARAYAMSIARALRVIERAPHRGKSRDDLRPGLLAYPVRHGGRPARHILFYRRA